MNSDTDALQNALSVLRQHYGDQLAGPQQRTEAQMRNTLRQQMGLDENQAALLVKELRDHGQLVYNAEADAASSPGTASTGPVISMPGTSISGGEAIITTASPDLIMGVANEEGGDADRALEDASEPVRAPEDAMSEGDRGSGYWSIGIGG